MVETVIGTAIGFTISVLTWEFLVKPIWHLQTSFVQNLNITLLFTVISIARSYGVRRLFNHLHTNKNKKVANDQTDRNYGPGPRG